jgi:hypothetical protein
MLIAEVIDNTLVDICELEETIEYGDLESDLQTLKKKYKDSNLTFLFTWRQTQINSDPTDRLKAFAKDYKELEFINPNTTNQINVFLCTI